MKVERLPTGRRRLIEPLVYDLEVHLEESLFKAAAVMSNGVHPSQYYEWGVFDVLDEESKLRSWVKVPAGFETDYSSIPWWARIAYNWRSVDMAGVVHDFLYSVGYPRKAADAVWYLLVQTGENKLGVVRAWLGYAALRIGGSTHWNG